ncbi:MAG: hypothetical protein K2N94_07985 [Lachnospiraceae bacterium]|nr:hypothetical protein [Lachnospiraceae bacterium]
MFEKEDLLEVVINLLNKYTSFDSDSVTYERAEQLMGAVAYCIREYEAERKAAAERQAAAAQNDPAENAPFPSGEDRFPQTALAAVPDGSAGDTSSGSDGSISAAEAYERGYQLVVEKTRAANRLYNEIMEQFCDYGSRAYRSTMAEEMPDFFLRYDARFAPQDELLLLDYPVLRPLEQLHGIDRIYEYLRCIRREQEFLRGFSEAYVRQTCRDYDADYEELFISLTEIMAASGGTATESVP